MPKTKPNRRSESQRVDQLNVRMSPELRQALRETARAQDLTVSQVVRHAVRDYVGDNAPA